MCSGEAGSFGPGENDTTSAAATAVGKPSGEFPVEVGEARLHGFAKCSATTAATAVAPTVAKSVDVGETWPPGLVKYSATSEFESELAESSDEASSSDEDEVPPWLLCVVKYKMQELVEVVNIDGEWQYLLGQGRDSEETIALRESLRLQQAEESAIR